MAAMGVAARNRGDILTVAYGFPGPPGGRFTAVLSHAVARTPPPCLLLLAIISLQMGSVLAIQLFSSLGPTGTVFLRVVFGAVLLAIATRPRIDHTLWRHAGLILLFGFLIAAMNLCFYQAISRIPLGIAVTIEFLGPLGVAILTSRKAVDILWVGLAAIGIGMLMPEIGAGLDPLGVLFAALAALSWAGFILLSPRVGRIFPGGTGLALAMIVAAILLLPLSVFSMQAIVVAPLVLFGALAVAVLSTTIPMSLEYEALKRMPPRTYGVVITIEPAVAMILGAVLLGDSIGWHGLMAVTAVMIAALGATFFDTRSPGR